MFDDLSQALRDAKTRRDVFSKTIIWESGVNKSQFYRILKGEEAPSIETKKRLCESLGLRDEQFDVLFEKSKSREKRSFENENPKTNKSLITLGFAIFLGSLILTASVIYSKKTTSSVATDLAVPGDQTLFIKDVTIPDGTSIPVNTTYEKIWRVKNTGTVVWKNRYLKRITPASDLLCSSTAMVPIPETQPGETIDISVTFHTPHLPGSCRTDWKTSDAQGNLYFPDMHGLFSIVTVVEN